MNNGCRILAVPISPFVDLDKSCCKCLLEEFCKRFPRFCVAKLEFILRFVQIHWRKYFSSVAQRCYTSYITNFEHLNTSTEYGNFTYGRDLDLLKESPNKSGVIVLSDSDYVCCNFEQVESSWVMFCVFSDTNWRNLFCVAWGHVYNILIK